MWPKRLWRSLRVPLGFAGLGIGAVCYQALVLGRTRFTGAQFSLAQVILLYVLTALGIGGVIFFIGGSITTRLRASAIGFCVAASLAAGLMIAQANGPINIIWFVGGMVFIGLVPGALVGAMHWDPPEGK